MSISLAPDAKAANVRIELLNATADQIENLIYRLAELRQDMAPEVPNYAPKNMMLIHEPDTRMATEANGRIKLAIRHGGLGWIDVHFTVDVSNAIRAACIRTAGEMKDDPTIFGPVGGHA